MAPCRYLSSEPWGISLDDFNMLSASSLVTWPVSTFLLNRCLISFRPLKEMLSCCDSRYEGFDQSALRDTLRLSMPLKQPYVPTIANDVAKWLRLVGFTMRGLVLIWLNWSARWAGMIWWGVNGGCNRRYLSPPSWSLQVSTFAPNMVRIICGLIIQASLYMSAS